jgi:hypothetical protein
VLVSLAAERNRHCVGWLSIGTVGGCPGRPQRDHRPPSGAKLREARTEPREISVRRGEVLTNLKFAERGCLGEKLKGFAIANASSNHKRVSNSGTRSHAFREG